MTTQSDDAKPAATLVLLRGGPRGPEIFMQLRAKTMGFAAGMMAFPGGKVDAADRALAGATGTPDDDDQDDRAARIAAVRETFEEAGVLLASGPDISAPALAVAQRDIAARTCDFGAFLGAHGQQLDLHQLTPFAHWVPPAGAGHLRYDTRFYLARLPDGAIAGHDGNEATHSLWTTAAEALARADGDGAGVIFPTRRNLERLAQFDSVDAIFAHADETPITRIEPRVTVIDGEPFLTIPENAGYPVTREKLSSAQRA